MEGRCVEKSRDCRSFVERSQQNERLADGQESIATARLMVLMGEGRRRGRRCFLVTRHRALNSESMRLELQD